MMKKSCLLCIGHRGAKGYKPENTLSSIYKALEMGVSYLEIDVHYVDGHLMVFHNSRLERTTNGVGYLEQQSFSYLRSLDAGEGQQIPTIEEVCEVIRARACLNIELRGASTAAPVTEFVANLVESGWEKKSILVSSFNHREILEVKRRDQDIQTGALLNGLLIDDAKFAEALGAFSVHPSLEFIDQRFVDDAHARGLQVYVHTVNHPEDIHKMSQLDVDGVFTDFPERVLENYSQGNILNVWTRRVSQ
jgi:glycerophosphoryl diester phosphodiesterase